MWFLSILSAALKLRFAATALITVGSLIYIYRKMLAVRKKVLIRMRDDLVAHSVKVSDMPQGQLSGRDER
jgi:hypothetical protein